MKFPPHRAALVQAVALALSAIAASPASAAPEAVPSAQGVLRVRSAYGVEETVARLKADIASKGIRFFTEIDQAQLGAGANIAIRPSRLILFGNPPLGVQFLSANPYSGLDWPVRMLVIEDADGSVSVAWSDFGFVGARYALKDRDAQLKMASEVAASIASSVSR